MSQESSYYSSDDGTQVASYTYDSESRRRAEIDPVNDVDFPCHDALGRLTQRPRGEVDKSTGRAGAAAAPVDPSFSVWTFGRFWPKRESAFEVYVMAPPGPSLSDWHNDFTIIGGTLTPAADLNDTPLGDGWYHLGSVTVAACTPELRVTYHGGREALGGIFVIKKLPKP